MGVAHSRKRGRNRRLQMIQKPRGVIHPRVQQVGPEHFGVLSVDCAKARSKGMLADFYGNVLVEPSPVEHNRPGLELAVLMTRDAMIQQDLCDVLVAVERTGRFSSFFVMASSFRRRFVLPVESTASPREPTEWEATRMPVRPEPIGCCASGENSESRANATVAQPQRPIDPRAPRGVWLFGVRET